MVALSALPFLAAAAALVAAHPHPHPNGLSSETSSAALPQRWYHDNDHPAHALFARRSKVKRDVPSPSVGSSEWTAQYPASTPVASSLPQEWVDALNDAVNAGKIPSIPVTTTSNGASPVYPAGVDQNRDNSTICAATNRVCRIPGDIWDAPDGVMGIGFDDGPTTDSPTLYTFLEQNNQSSTHYMIGVNILNNWKEFQIAYDQLDSDIAVHTWTHPYMTTQTNEEVLAQLAWTIQIIYDSTGGKIPRFWRPPYGDIDTRVSAIAREVLGMTAIMWNQDTEDWSMLDTPPGTTPAKIQSSMEQWLSGPKSPGLIILEHELANSTIAAFIAAYPLAAQNGWKTISQAQLNDSMDTYQDGEESDEAFNSLLPSSADSETASSTSTAGSSSQASGTLESGSAPSQSGPTSAQSNTSGSIPSFVFPSSLATIALFLGSLLALA